MRKFGLSHPCSFLFVSPAHPSLDQHVSHTSSLIYPLSFFFFTILFSLNIPFALFCPSGLFRVVPFSHRSQLPITLHSFHYLTSHSLRSYCMCWFLGHSFTLMNKQRRFKAAIPNLTITHQFLLLILYTFKTHQEI